MSLNLEEQLLFYGSYHHDSTNIAIHVVCVPLLLLSGILLGTNSPSLVPLPSWLTIPNLPPNLGTIFALLYAGLYILMEPVAGGLLAPIIIAATAWSKYLTSTYGMTANYWAAGLHVVCWVAQFIGHGVFEGRKPALLDNLVQAVFLAPFFVWMEILFFFGYRPELKSRLEKAVEIEIEKVKKSRGQSNGKAVNGKAHS